MLVVVFFFKQKTAYEMRISDWSSDVCSSDLARRRRALTGEALPEFVAAVRGLGDDLPPDLTGTQRDLTLLLLCTGLRWTSAAGLRWPEVDFRAKTITVPADRMKGKVEHTLPLGPEMLAMLRARRDQARSKEFVFPGLPKDEKGTMAPIGRLSKRFLDRSEEHTSELQSLMRISYAVFCLTHKKTHK